MIRRSGPGAPQSTKPGRNGTLRLFGFTLTPDYPGQAPYPVYRWAYDLDHAWNRADEELSVDGETVTEVFRARIVDEGGAQ